MAGDAELTRLLSAHAGGDEEALAEAFSLVYGELKRLAHSKRRDTPGAASLETTGLVHEAFLKLAGSRGAPPRDRGHFFAIAATAMRQILVDHARSRGTAKRGGGRTPVTLDPEAVALEREVHLTIAVDRALEKLARTRPRQVRIFECRYFAGLTTEETAQAVDASARTVEREWKEVRDWLSRELGGSGSA